MDEIRIDNLEVYAGHGVYEHEKRNGQSFFVNAVLFSDLKRAGKSDALADSTSYGDIARLISHFLREHRFQLLEAAAEDCAKEILTTFDKIDRVILEIRKPSAPIGLPFESVSVRIERGFKRAYVAVGSNMGDKKNYILEAVEKLKADQKIRHLRCSTLIETEPYGGVEQDAFINGVLELDTLYGPLELLHLLQKIELEAGRERKIHWGPRTLDLDILFYEDFISGIKELTVPHPDMQNRSFVLDPMDELNPGYVHPLLQKTIRQMKLELEGDKNDRK